MREPFNYLWSADGHIADPTAASSRITFDWRLGNPGSTDDKSVTCNVTDADGKTAIGQTNVGFFARPVPPDNTPICHSCPPGSHCVEGVCERRIPD
jgi:hypothetical protein